MKLPEFESDAKDREIIRENLDQYSQIDHDEDAKRLINIMDSALGLEKIMKRVDYMTIESYGKINPERISEKVVQKIQSSIDLYDEAKEGKNEEIKKIHIKTAVRNFLAPVNKVSTNEKWCGDCCNIAAKKISIKVGKDLERVMRVEKIIAGKTFLEGLGSMIDISRELQCEIPGVVDMTVMEKEKKIALSELIIKANRDNTLVLKDECFGKESLEKNKKTPQKILDIVRECRRCLSETRDNTAKDEVQERIRRELNTFSVIDIQNIFDNSFKERNEIVSKGNKEEMIELLMDQKYEQISSYRHCDKGESLNLLLGESRRENKNRIAIHVQPEHTAMSEADAKSIYGVDLKLGDNEIKAQIIACQKDGSWAIYFNEGGYHHKIEVRGKDVYKPTKISQKLFDAIIEVCKKT